MTEAQVLAIAITVLAVLGGTLVNNTRIGDVKEVLRAELKAQSAQLDSRIDKLEIRIDSRIDKLEAKIDRIGDTLA